ncbi:MAG: hypothetical protein WCP06_03270 [Verrucomicrobiota bacterium]
METLQTRNDLIEHGDLACLIAVDVPETQSVAIEQFTQLGFGIHTALSSEEFTTKFHANPYDVIVISEQLGACDVDTNPAIAELVVLSPIQRRELFVVLIGPNMVSRSEMQAFHYSVDITVNQADAHELKTIAGRGILKQEEFYAAFNSVLKAMRAGG